MVVAASEVEVEVEASALAQEGREVSERALVPETPLLVGRKRRNKGLNQYVHVEERICEYQIGR